MVLSVILLGAAGAHAQEGDEGIEASFPVQNFKMAPGTGNFLTVEGARVGTHLQWMVGLIDVFQYKPYIILTCAADSGEGQCDGASERVAVVEYHDSIELLASISIFNWVQIGLAWPFTVYQKGKNYNPELATVEGDLESWGGIGDPRLHFKVRLVGEPGKDGFGMALIPVLGLPVGGYGPWGDSYAGNKMVTVHANLALGYTWNGLNVGINAGYFWREEARVYATSLEDQLTYGVGVSYRAHRYVGILGELFGSVALSRSGYYKGFFSDNESETPLEADGAVEIYPIKDLKLIVGGGAGILSAIGSPVFRVFLGLAYAPVPDEEKAARSDDRDNDGIKNKQDKCPDEPEDLDEFEDEDGCPDKDDDQDGVPDGYDSCPTEKEDMDNFEDDDGCPDLDHDGDTIPDETDKCPESDEDIDSMEDMDGFEDEDGCPDEDNDKDGLPDPKDVCPDEAEDKDGFNDEDGCPEPDNDEDGIPDESDQCPDEAEVFNGIKDEDGCPDKGKVLVVITETELKILQKINFKKDSDEIKGKDSFKVLDTVAAILKANPSVVLEVQGHTDDTGTRAHNLDLSQRRAESVKAYLVERGVESSRLEPKGYGPDVPIASNKTKAGREENRRVEFHIVTMGSSDEPAGDGAPEEEVMEE
ncbi:MAG: OmpA family protein [Pseudomonadota bacterium]